MNVISRLQCKGTKKKGRWKRKKRRIYYRHKVFLTYIKKKLAAPSGTANFLSVSNLKVSDQQQQEPYQPHCPHTS